MSAEAMEVTFPVSTACAGSGSDTALYSLHVPQPPVSAAAFLVTERTGAAASQSCLPSSVS